MLGTTSPIVTPACHEPFTRQGFTALFVPLLVFTAAGLLSGCLRMQVLAAVELDLNVCVTRGSASEPVAGCEVQTYIQLPDGTQNEFLPRTLGVTDEEGCLHWQGSLRYCYNRRVCTHPENKALILIVKFMLEEKEQMQIAVPLDASKAISPHSWWIELDEKL
jgi:hypothetical protein